MRIKGDIRHVRNLIIIIVITVLYLASTYLDHYKFGLKMPKIKRKRTNFVASNDICKDILHIQDPSRTAEHSDMRLVMEQISMAKKKKDYIRFAYYYFLSTFFPSLFGKTEPFQGVNGSNFTVMQESKLSRMSWQIPYLPCRLREYSGEDAYTCVRKRNEKNKNFRITFIGDSRVRRPMEYLLELLHRYNLTIEVSDGTKISIEDFLGDRGNILWPKYKQKLIVYSPNLPNFLISYTWAPFLSLGDDPYPLPFYKKYLKEKMFAKNLPKFKNNTEKIDENDYIKSFKNSKMKPNMQTATNRGAIDELKRLLRKPAAQLPEFIIIDTSSWYLMDFRRGILQNLELWAVDGTLKIRKALEELSTRTTVILLLPQPFKDYLNGKKDAVSYFRIQNNYNQEWYLNAQLQLMPKNVLIWDSMLPVAYSSIEDCIKILTEDIDLSLLPKIQRFDESNSYSCSDKMHLGYESLQIAVQMILNQICNRHMDKQKTNLYCCEN